MAGRYLQIISNVLCSVATNQKLDVLRCEGGGGRSRFQRLSDIIQKIFNLAGLLSELIQRTRIVGCIVTSRSTELIVHAQVIPSCSPYLSHSLISRVSLGRS